MQASKSRIALTLILSFAATYFFFFEYLPPKKSVHFFGDIEGFHYPLFFYAAQALREMRLPEWDSSIYCGMTFTGNPQAAVFYPPNWLVYYMNLKRTGVRFTWIEILLVLHFWIAFALAWGWLRTRFKNELAAVLGGAVFAFGGYPLNETQHLGMLCGYAWYPLGLWGVDQSREQRSWRPLWKTAVASALCLLAGYPTQWVVFCVSAVVYALCRAGFSAALKTSAAIAFSLLLAMVQVAPAWEGSQLKWRELTYGGGIPGGWFFYLNYLMPNYYDQSHRQPPGLAETSYMYLGAAAVVAILLAIAYRRWRDLVPAIGIIAAALMFIDDPFTLIIRTSRITPVLNETLRQWNFVCALTLAGAYTAACGVAALAEKAPSWKSAALFRCTIAVTAVWTIRQLYLWSGDGVGFAVGWWSLAEVFITGVLVFALLRFHSRRVAAAALVILVWTDYKVYGTSRRFNSAPGNVDVLLRGDRRTGGPDFQGVDSVPYSEMLRHPEYRVGFDDGPATDLRYYDLASPLGFDPFLTAAYREEVERFTPFLTNRTFSVDWNNTAMLEAFGVRYLIVSPTSKARGALPSDPRFRLIGPAETYSRVYEYRDAKPAFRFDAGTAETVDWKPQHRQFRVRSVDGGEFQLIEQYFPGWRAFIDGQSASINRFRGAFQSVRVPPGEHRVEFRYRSTSLRAGAAVSLLALAALIVGLRWTHRASRA